MSEQWAGTSVLVTGGLGFIGSNLCIELVERDAEVQVLDAKLEGYGANDRNVAPVADDLTVVTGDVREADTVQRLVADADVVYHCAAQLSRPVSVRQPTTDVEINCGGTTNVLSAAAEMSDPPRVVFTSSQAVVGAPDELPVDETTRAEPLDVYGANKRAGEMYCSVYGKTEDVPNSVVRLSNVYGPRAQLQNPNYGVVNRFLRLALEDAPLPVFEPGTMRRDFVHVDDVVAALLRLGRSPTVIGERYMLGSGRSISVQKLAETIVDVAGSGRVKMVEWPDDWDSIRVGDIVTNPAKLRADTTWEPTVELVEGLEPTLEYYRNNREAYLK